MDEPRDVQTSQRNDSRFRQILSAGSAVAMEIKRKKIRQSTLFLQTEVMLEVHFERCLLFPRSFLLPTFDRKVRSAPILSSTFLRSNVSFPAVNDKTTVGVYLNSFCSVNAFNTILLMPLFSRNKGNVAQLGPALHRGRESPLCVVQRSLKLETTFSSFFV